MTASSRDERAKAAVLSTLAADSLSLGPHWVYDTGQIDSQLGRVETLMPPTARYHSGKEAGHFTHYGDQALVLLESVAVSGSFDLDDFFSRWRDLFDGYEGYVDGASRKTLQRVEFGEGPTGSGSNSDDLAGASRLGVLVRHLGGDGKALEEAAVAQAAMTHNNPLILDSARFFSRTIVLVLDGATPTEAMRAAAEMEYVSAPVDSWVESGIRSIDTDTRAVISRFGQSCHVDSAFPGVVHLIAKYERDLKEAVVESAMAGGDSSARAMLAAAVLAASLGPDAVPAEWVDKLKAIDHIRTLVA